MKKKLTVLIFLLFSIISIINAQVMSIEATKRKAFEDVQNFKLNKTDLKIFRMNGKNSNSDLFKPTANSTSISSLLTDSTYVKEYRELAYKKTKRRKTLAHYVLIGGVSFTIAAAIVMIGLTVAH